MEHTRFNDDQLDYIRDIFGDLVHTYRPQPSMAEECLAIVNVCQKALDCPEFESLSQFYHNRSNLWTEIDVDEDLDFDY